MVRDLVENAIQIVRKQQYSRVYARAVKKANRRLVKVLVPGIKKEQKKAANPYGTNDEYVQWRQSTRRAERRIDRRNQSQSPDGF